MSRRKKKGTLAGLGKGKERSRRIDLGLALLERRAIRGQELTSDDIAAWCGCARSTIQLLERMVRKKVANRLKFGRLKRLGAEVMT